VSGCFLSIKSPVLFCLHIDGFLVALSKAEVGWFIGEYFLGALDYSPMTSIVLLAPSAQINRLCQ